MQLDNTRIAVRERSLLDICDLALRVIRRDALPIALSFAAGALPLLLFNHLLIGWMLDPAQEELFYYAEDTVYYADEGSQIVRFVWNMSLLVAIEAPLASLLTTSYLGQAMFVTRPSWRTMLRDAGRMLPRILWCQVLIRGVLAAWLLLLLLDRGGEFDAAIEILGMGGLACYVLGLRGWRPFLTEIVLLERNPLRGRAADAITVSRRSSQLHGPSAGDLLVRGAGIGLLAMCLTMSVFGTFVFCEGVFLNDWEPGALMLGWLLPLAMWIVAGFLCVVRFLNYLDLRIRHEGWEVELRMRAEGERLQSRLT